MKKFDRKWLLKQIKESLQSVYKERLKGILLYGSEARGEALEDSDIDFLVLLKGPIRLGMDLRTIINTLYPLQLKIFRPLHGIPVDHEVFKSGEYALYREAKKDGIFA